MNELNYFEQNRGRSKPPEPFKDGRKRRSTDEDEDGQGRHVATNRQDKAGLGMPGQRCRDSKAERKR